jgi:hypothetical protein
MSRPPVNGDLFGVPRAAERDHTPVTLGMDYLGATDLGIFLRPAGRKGGEAWAPIGQVARAGDRYTMPRWVALERGWL